MAKEVGGQSEMNAPIRDTKTSEQDLLLKKKLVAEVAAAETEARGGDAHVAADTSAQSAEVTLAVAGGVDVDSMGIVGESASDADSGFPTWAVVGGAAVVAGAGIALASDDGDDNNNNPVDPDEDNTAPTITSASSFSVAENTTTVGTLTGSDADGDTLSFAISGGADADKFVLNGQTLSFASAPDFETDATSYTVEVTVSDGHGGTATQTVTVNVTDVDETPAAQDIALTTGLDLLALNPGDQVFGDETTLTSGDNIKGQGNGTVFLQLTGAGNFSGQTITDVTDIQVSSSGGLNLLTTNWDTPMVTLNENVDDVTLTDLQSTDTFFEVNDFVDATGSLTLNFDAQATTGATEVDMSVQEVQGVAVALTGGSIETVNLEIADVSSDADSNLASFSATGMTTLNIMGGAADLDFSIDSPLQAGLTTLDASGAASNLTLDVSDSTTSMTVALGTGDDFLYVGDTMGPLAEVDTFSDAGGDDVLMAAFTSAGTRHPISTDIETFDLYFGANAKLNMSDVDGTENIIIESSAAYRFEVVEMDSDVSYIHLIDQQYAGKTYSELRWEDGANADVDVTWSNNSGAGAATLAIILDDVQHLDLEADGTDNVYIGAWIADENLDTLDVTVSGDGDFYSYYGIVFYNETLTAVDTSNLTDATFTTTDSGDLYFGAFSGGPFPGGSGAIIQAESLETLTITSSESGSVSVGDIGSYNYARNLESIVVDAHAVFGFGAYGYGTALGFVNAGGASISTIDIAVDDDAGFLLNGIYAQDISDWSVTLQQNSYVQMGYYGIYLINQGDELSVSGQGYMLTGAAGYDLYFAGAAFAEMDFSGLSNDNVSISFQNDVAGSHLVTTAFADYVYSGYGSDAINLGGGNDYLYDVGGSNVIVAGSGADYVYLYDGGLFGYDGANALLMGGTSITAAGGTDDTVTGYLGFTGNDTIAFTGGAAGTAANYGEGTAADDTFATALADADAYFSGAGTGDLYYFSQASSGDHGFLFFNNDGDGEADLYIEIFGTGANEGTFGATDIIAATDPVFTGV
jgi:hypothetical protein